MIFLIGAAGGFGAVCRYWVDAGTKMAITTPTPFSTAVINMLGSFFLGFIAATQFDPAWSVVLGVGFCGGFTTFSTASVEVAILLRDKRRLYAVNYAVLMCVLSVLAAAVGAIIPAS
ncbi:fluoride efflux transporter CrcB [Arcanobacterium phocisimile]|uniref:Fluoride-specific ion channel FluC n=1 Tax=Arcanobacterium phocisimile TaxID=1302235 RepID=A0ABX7IGD9_9ACTO|nr:fluoride efflux transporter CrcB [Arcanobacterium phocisimile]QRV01529.1 fluoride efflux transporter CrcB [Arcanobacterium phocisimile]